VTFKVQVPVVPDKPEWKLNGQQLTITLPITDPVSFIWSIICGHFGVYIFSAYLHAVFSCTQTNTLYTVSFFFCSHQVSVIKARIADELGMPTGKQKLQVGVRHISTA